MNDRQLRCLMMASIIAPTAQQIIMTSADAMAHGDAIGPGNISEGYGIALAHAAVLADEIIGINPKTTNSDYLNN